MITRRDFLKTIAVGGTAALAMGYNPKEVSGSTENKKVEYSKGLILPRYKLYYLIPTFLLPIILYENLLLKYNASHDIYGIQMRDGRIHLISPNLIGDENTAYNRDQGHHFRDGTKDDGVEIVLRTASLDHVQFRKKEPEDPDIGITVVKTGSYVKSTGIDSLISGLIRQCIDGGAYPVPYKPTFKKLSEIKGQGLIVMNRYG